MCSALHSQSFCWRNRQVNFPTVILVICPELCLVVTRYWESSICTIGNVPLTVSSTCSSLHAAYKPHSGHQSSVWLPHNSSLCWQQDLTRQNDKPLFYTCYMVKGFLDSGLRTSEKLPLSGRLHHYWFGKEISYMTCGVDSRRLDQDFLQHILLHVDGYCTNNLPASKFMPDKIKLWNFWARGSPFSNNLF